MKTLKTRVNAVSNKVFRKDYAAYNNPEHNPISRRACRLKIRSLNKKLPKAVDRIFCPLGDYDGALRSFENELYYLQNEQIKHYFEHLFEVEQEKAATAYYAPDKEGMSAADYDRAMYMGG